MKSRLLGLTSIWFLCNVIGIQQVRAQSSSLLFLNRILNDSYSESTKSTERISSGKYLLPDDPASYVIYDSLEKQVRGLMAMIRNDADMVSYYQYQESMLGSVIDLLQRIRELLLERSNGFLDDSDKEIIDSEITQNYEEIGTTITNANFNQMKILSSSDSAILLNKLNDKNHYELGNVDKLLQFIISLRTTSGAKANALGFTSMGQREEALNATSFLSQGDTNISKEMNSLLRSQILLMVNLMMF